MPNINVYQQDSPTTEELPVEYVERKGIGHPDTLMDGICESVSQALSKHYIESFGMVLHHNVDKGLLVGGSAEVSFGNGKVTKPIQIIIAGRATQSYQGIDIPVDEIAKKAAKDYLKAHTRFLDVEKEVVISTQIMKGSSDLTALYSRSTDVPLANDTSIAVGAAPLTKTERLALEVERFLNSPDYKKKMPMVGEDIKTLGLREGKRFSLNIAAAFVAQHVRSIDDYMSYKKMVVEDVKSFAKKLIGEDVAVSLNTGDSIERKEVYITKTGLSCESGDDGEVGRGNRVNGLITPFRRFSMEAAAGKNPISHTGKIYNVLANEIANEIVKIHPQVSECEVTMVSNIGERINEPRDISILVKMKKGEKMEPIKQKINEVADDLLNNIAYMSREMADGKYGVF